MGNLDPTPINWNGTSSDVLAKQGGGEVKHAGMLIRPQTPYYLKASHLCTLTTNLTWPGKFL